LTLARSSVDPEAGTLRIEPGRAKNQDARLVFLTPQLKADIADQLTRVKALEREIAIISPWLLVHLRRPQKDKCIRDVDPRWQRVRREVSCGRVFRHNLRRTAAREMVGLGMS
jgi:hypothetical protein